MGAVSTAGGTSVSCSKLPGATPEGGGALASVDAAPASAVALG
jgi:hypothetical protein